MVIHLGHLELLQNLTDLLLLDLLRVRDAFLAELPHDRLNHVLGNVRILLGLELRQPFIKVIDLLVREICNLPRGILVRRLLRVDQDELLVAAAGAAQQRLILQKRHFDVAGRTAAPPGLNS